MAVAVAGVVTRDQPADTTPAGTPVVLAEDAPLPSPTPSPEPRTDVVCSDLRRRSVPTRLLDDTEPGSLSHLSWGPCVVIGPEGATLP